MPIKYFFIAVALMVAGCNSDRTKDETTAINKENEGTGPEQQQSSSNTPNGFWEKLETIEIRDQNGVVSLTMPFPSSWKMMPASNGGPSITGPHGIKVTDYPLRNFFMNYNMNIQHAYAGQQMREMPGVEQLILQDFVPWARQNGLELVKFYEIPEVSSMDKWYSDALYKAMPSRSEVVAIGVDWKANDGSQQFSLIHLNVSTSETMQQWYYIVSHLEAEPDYLDGARKQLIFSLANKRYNLEPIMAYNKAEAQRVGQNWAAFNQRMAQNQANFEANQRAFVNKSNAINDAIMSGWRERNAASDRQQERTIDGIYERTNVQDVESGQKFKVSAGANQYWMNSEGEYIGTQLQGYNPNLDQNMNEQKWKQLKQIKQ